MQRPNLKVKNKKPTYLLESFADTMMDYFEQFNKQKEINEGLFGNLFSKTTKVPPAPVNKDFYEKDGLYYFGGVSTTKKINEDAKRYLLTNEFDLRNSNLSFMLLPGTEFHADQILLDLKKQVINFFNGTWNSGPFYGKTFNGTFKGSAFNGAFNGAFGDYESHPTTFVEGTFRDTTGSGLLGMPNTTTLNKAKNRKFNLITIPVGHYLQFRSVNGITGYIKIVKRLDGTNSTFVFEVLDGFKGNTSPVTANYAWDFIRQNWKIMEINPKDPINFGGLINVPPTDSIKELYISTAPATFITPAAMVPPVVTQTNTSGGFPNIKTKKSIKSTISGGLGRGPLPESLRIEVRTIINDSF